MSYTLYDVSREDIDCMIGDQGESGPALERGGTLEMAVRMAKLTGCRANGGIRAGSRILETAGRWTMPARRFNEADIDFDAMDGELAKLVPPKLSLTDVLDRLRKRLVEQQAKGVTVAQMHEVLKSGGIDITERSPRTFLDKGVLPGRKVAEVARAMVSEQGSDPF